MKLSFSNSRSHVVPGFVMQYLNGKSSRTMLRFSCIEVRLSLRLLEYKLCAQRIDLRVQVPNVFSLKLAGFYRKSVVKTPFQNSAFSKVSKVDVWSVHGGLTERLVSATNLGLSHRKTSK